MISLELSRGSLYNPFSPCIPRPTSIVFSSSYQDEDPGNEHVLKLTPIVYRFSFTYLLKALILPKLRDYADPAPMILYRSTVPANPLLCSKSSGSQCTSCMKAMSSPTTSDSTRMPKNYADYFARLKFRMSPVQFFMINSTPELLLSADMCLMAARICWQGGEAKMFPLTDADRMLQLTNPAWAGSWPKIIYIFWGSST